MVTSAKKPLLPAVDEPLSKLLWVAVWFALLTGCGEVFLLMLRKYYFQRWLGFGPHVLWMAPLAEVCCFGLCGLLLLAVGHRWPRLRSLRLVVWLFAFSSFWGLISMYPKLHGYAVLLLAAGLATQTARLIARHPQAFLTLVHRTTGWLLAGIGSLALAMLLWPRVSEQHTIAHLPPAPAGAPNVLLITLDTVRAQSLSLYGYTKPTTPQLERWAHTGVRFERAFATAPWTLPSHASIFTGHFPHETQANWYTPLNTTYPTLAEVLRSRGYMTAGFTANMLYSSYETGLNRGFIHYEDYLVSPTQFFLSSALIRTVANAAWFRRLLGSHQIFDRKAAPDVNRAFLQWLTHHGQRPFFVFLNYFDAHEPYLPPPPFDTLSGPRGWWEDIQHRTNTSTYDNRWKMSPSEVKIQCEAYEGSIAYLDHHIGILLDELQHRGVLDHALVIITADHGEQFGEHRLYVHGNSLYSQVLHVPLVLLFPQHVPTGRSIPDPVSLRDLPATVLDLIGLAGKMPFPGHSLAQYWASASRTTHPRIEPLLAEVSYDLIFNSGPEWYVINKGDMQSLVFDGYHYIRNGDGSEELYDLMHDPLEDHDIAHSEIGRRLYEQARQRLDSLLAPARLSHH